MFCLLAYENLTNGERSTLAERDDAKVNEKGRRDAAKWRRESLTKMDFFAADVIL